jgi:dynein heavy chain 1
VTLLSQSIYGGKIDNDFDQRLLQSFLKKLFTAHSFEADFPLVSNIDNPNGQRHITMPDGTRRDHFMKWIENLADRQTPSWLGLPNNAEKVLLTTRGTDLIGKLLKMQQLEDDDELAYNPQDDHVDKTALKQEDGRPSWMKVLHNSAVTWLQLLPKSLQTLRRTVENIKDPLYRYFEREVSCGAKLLQTVVSDLQDVIYICQGEKKQTNYHRQMLSELVRGILPAGWRRYIVPTGCTVIQWITDFSHRVHQLQEVSTLVSQAGAKELQSFPVWLGGLFNPEAYITATRQCVAQANSWPLEELALDVTITEQSGEGGHHKDSSFGVTGLKLQGAQCKNNQLLLTSTIMMDLPLTLLRWIRNTSQTMRSGKLTLPVYLNSTRAELLFTVDLAYAPGQEPHSFYERGVAILTSTALN